MRRRVRRGRPCRDVADGYGYSAGAVVEEVVDVAADGAGGEELGGELGAVEVGRAGRHEAKLDLASHLEVALHALLFFVDALVEPRIRDGDGDLRGEGAECALMVVVEVVDAGVLEVEDADDLALVDERDSELGACLGVDDDVARILADIGGEDRLAELRGGADDALAERRRCARGRRARHSGRRSGARTARCARSTGGW